MPLKGTIGEYDLFLPALPFSREERNGHRSTVSARLLGLLDCDLAWPCREESWPITVVVKCGDKGVKPGDGLHKLRPRSDFLISNSGLPRLLVEVGSASGNSDIDLIRMLTTGAFIVRFANRFLSAFCQERTFVLCAFYIWDNGTATRYTLFQQQTKNDEVVCCAFRNVINNSRAQPS